MCLGSDGDVMIAVNRIKRSHAVAATFAILAVLMIVWALVDARMHAAHAQTCRASYYGKAFHGRRTASGERFNMWGMTAASRTLKLGTRLRVSRDRYSVVVRINDRGPYVRGRCLDLARGAAARLHMLQAGVAAVRIEVLP
jgi:peptidoglycan lytic transglycosylase